MKSGKLKYSFYSTLDSMPIWNWYQLHKTKNIRYLLKLSDYDVELYVRPFWLFARLWHKIFVLPKIGKNYITIDANFGKILKLTYDSLLNQYDKKLNLSVLERKRDLMSMVLDMVAEIFRPVDTEKLTNAGIVLSALMVSDNPDMDWIYKVDFTTNNDQRKMINRLAKAITAYHVELKDVDESKMQTLEAKKVIIESNLNVGNIDLKACSVKQMEAYEEALYERAQNFIKNNPDG